MFERAAEAEFETCFEEELQIVAIIAVEHDITSRNPIR
jgi:hypothetical protein